MFHSGSNKNVHLCIIGIGMNVNSDTRRSPDLHSIATSVQCELEGQNVSREKLVAGISGYLEEFLPLYSKDCYKKVIQHQLFSVGQHVHIYNKKSGETRKGRLLAIQEDWSVKLQGSFIFINIFDRSLIIVFDLFKFIYGMFEVQQNNKIFLLCAEDEGDVIHGYAFDISLRPCTVHNTIIYGGHLALTLSSSALLKTMCGVLDTSKTTVEMLNHLQFMDGNEHMME